MSKCLSTPGCHRLSRGLPRRNAGAFPSACGRCCGRSYDAKTRGPWSELEAFRCAAQTKSPVSSTSRFWAHIQYISILKQKFPGGFHCISMHLQHLSSWQAPEFVSQGQWLAAFSRRPRCGSLITMDGHGDFNRSTLRLHENHETWGWISISHCLIMNIIWRSCMNTHEIYEGFSSQVSVLAARGFLKRNEPVRHWKSTQEIGVVTTYRHYVYIMSINVYTKVSINGGYPNGWTVNSWKIRK